MIRKYRICTGLNASLFKYNPSLILARSLTVYTSHKFYSLNPRVVEPSVDDTSVYEKMKYNPQEEAKQARSDMTGDSEQEKIPPQVGIDDENLKQAMKYEHEHPSHKSHKHRRDEKSTHQQQSKDISISEE
ncbi:hypothetical protein FDP41_001990 [Naegleria fowleri]|uniref:Uncharacterized protein n=1 Tax=Naegleria fowleri TaxID=5763 RepID=A0A6A5BZB6_NAEFO|nr:uncharacterized protein FDP41_001990 [Naegleria fowleri]KAF0978920.1 hypothetical protein FDP41_001990 [Naegleria fowleri]CAG4712019.1 unnamed protein product [Naegleria fowleri]